METDRAGALRYDRRFETIDLIAGDAVAATGKERHDECVAAAVA